MIEGEGQAALNAAASPPSQDESSVSLKGDKWGLSPRRPIQARPGQRFNPAAEKNGTQEPPKQQGTGMQTEGLIGVKFIPRTNRNAKNP